MMLTLMMTMDDAEGTYILLNKRKPFLFSER